MSKFESDKDGLLCPWCAPKKIPGRFGGLYYVHINDCPHNPFKLTKRVEELEAKLEREQKAARVLADLKEYLDYIA